MIRLMRFFQSIILFFIVFILLSSCSLLKKSIPEKIYGKMSPDQEISAREESRYILSTLASLNKDLKSFKGIGKLKLWARNNDSIHERFAWIASKPSSIGIAILVSGQPVMRFSTDGKYIYIIDLNNPKKSYRKFRTRDARLDKLVSIPIRAEEIVKLLAGQVPLKQHTTSILVSQPQNSGYVLLLENSRKRTLEKIFIDVDKNKVKTIEMLNPKGGLLYRAEFEDMRIVEKFRVPSRLKVTNDKGDGFLITVKRFMANTPITSSAFILKPPDHP